jgi:hypothetical protein
MAITKAEAIARGARGITIRESELRLESLEWLRAGKPTYPATMVPRLHVYPDTGITINDGRHRIFLARERGETHIAGKIVGYGPKGGQLWSHTGRFPI